MKIEIEIEPRDGKLLENRPDLTDEIRRSVAAILANAHMTALKATIMPRGSMYFGGKAK
jgi:hypothetical protein